MLTREEIWDLFVQTGAVLKGHFRYTSGLHGDTYVQCARINEYPAVNVKLCGELARRMEESKPDMVIGPALGGIVLAYEIARQLETRAMFAEREDGKLALRRGFEIQPGERVLVVEDVVTTGGTIQELLELVEAQGGKIAATAAYVDRSRGRVALPNFHSLLQLDLATYPPEDCPLCRQGLPLVKPGSRKLMP